MKLFIFHTISCAVQRAMGWESLPRCVSHAPRTLAAPFCTTNRLLREYAAFSLRACQVAMLTMSSSVFYIHWSRSKEHLTC